MDSRYETVYPESTNFANSAALSFGSERNLATLRALNPTHILIPNSPSYHDHELSLRESWRLVYQDQQFLVLSRNSEEQVSQKEALSKVEAARPNLWLPLF